MILRICALLLSIASVTGAVSAAELPTDGLPDWLLGQWQVTKIYEDRGKFYPDPAAEPRIYYRDQIMTIELGRIIFTDSTCADITVKEKLDTVANLLKQETGYGGPERIGLKPKIGQVYYFDVKCGKRFREIMGNTLEERPGLSWRIIPDGHSKIDMPFFGGSYLELRKLGPTS
jgi:hypothetical protein